MKALQINFFLFPEELDKFQEYLSKNHWLVAVSPVAKAEVRILEKISNSVQGKKYIFLAEQADKLVFKSIPEQKHFVIDQKISPVIEFSAGNMNQESKQLIRGRLYFEKENANANFLEMASKLFAWFKKNYKNVKTPPYDLAGFIVSQKVADWVQTEKAELR